MDETGKSSDGAPFRGAAVSGSHGGLFPRQKHRGWAGADHHPVPHGAAPAAGHRRDAGVPRRPERTETEGEAAFPININTATAEQLQALPGIGKARAEAIIAYREEHGPFTYVEDLRAVSGIGKGILANIIDYITVEEQNNGKNISG